MKQPAHINPEVNDQVNDQVNDEMPVHGDGLTAPNAEIEVRDGSGVAQELARDNQRLGPSLPGYHWHSVVAARGWEQPTLDGRNGGEDPSAWLHGRTRAEERKPTGPATARSSRPI